MSATDKKPVGVWITRSPFEDHRIAERLRMAVGLTLGKNSVRIFLSGDGVYVLLKSHPEKGGLPPLGKHLETLGLLKCSLVAEEESLSQGNISREAVPYPIEILPREEFLRRVSACQVLFNE